MRDIHTRRRFTLAMITLTAAALTLPASVHGELLDDFNDGDDVGGTRFTLPLEVPGASWDASRGVYRLSVEEWAESSTKIGSREHKEGDRPLRPSS